MSQPIHKELPLIERRFLKERSIDEESKVDIVETIKNYLLHREDMVFAYLHGSFVETSSFRDIDVAIFLKRPEREMEIESDLSYELTEKVGCPVEVRVINRAHVAFQMAVLKNGRAILSRSYDLRTDFIEDVSRRYREYIHFRNIVLSA